MRNRGHPENWRELNARLNESDLEGTKKLYDAERRGQDRLRFRVRIYCRLNKLRADHERELVKKGVYVP